MTIETKALKEDLKRIKGFIGTNQSLSILSNVRINRNRLEATDLKKTIAVNLPEDIGFDICVPFRDFSMIIDRTRFETVEIDLEKDVLSIRCGDYDAEIPTVKSGQFPDLDIPESGFEPIPSDFRVAVMMLAKYASDDDSRPTMNGIFVDGRNVISTDGRRMGVYKMGKGGGDIPEVIIPSHFLKEYTGIDVDQFVMTDRQIWFSGPDGKIGAYLIEGTFPNWKRVLPKKDDIDFSFPFDKQILSGAGVVSAMLGENRMVQIVFEPRMFMIKSTRGNGKILYKNEIGWDETEDPDTHTKTPGFEYPEVSAYVNFDNFIDLFQSDTVNMSIAMNDAKKEAKVVQVEAGEFKGILATMLPPEM